jgi:hypothetical protein
MKKSILFLLVASLCYTSGFYVGQSLNELPNDNKDITFIWNDDEESIPYPGTPIMLEMIDEETVYIGPIK